jgi:uncharacterized protein (TIGR03083 family)
MVDTLDDDQWNGQTLCDGWTPHDVLAHLTWFADTQSFLSAIEANDFNLAAAIADGVSQLRQRSTTELINTLREYATAPLPIPGAPEQGTVCDIAIHTQDVRRGLGLPGDLIASSLQGCLEFIVTHDYAAIMFDRTKVQGLRLVASDIDWTHGDGLEVVGPAESLMMALAGRPTLAELTGAGTDTLTGRLES